MSGWIGRPVAGEEQVGVRIVGNADDRPIERGSDLAALTGRW